MTAKPVDVGGSHSPTGMGRTAEGLEAYGGFDDEERLAIERENALGLFPRLRER